MLLTVTIAGNGDRGRGHQSHAMIGALCFCALSSLFKLLTESKPLTGCQQFAISAVLFRREIPDRCLTQRSGSD